MGTVITKLKIKKEDNTFDEKDIGVWSDNVKCKLPVIDQDTGEIVQNEYYKGSLTDELISQKDYNNINNNNIDNLFNQITLLFRTAYNYNILLSETEGVTLLNENQNIAFITVQLKFYGKLLPLVVIDSYHNNDYQLHYSILSESNKIEVFSTLNVQLNENVGSSRNEEVVLNKEILISLKDSVYYQTNLTTGTITKSTSQVTSQELQIVQVNGLING